MSRDRLIGLGCFVGTVVFLELWGLRDLPTRVSSTLSLVIGFLVSVIYQLEAEIKGVKRELRSKRLGHDAA